MIAVGKKKEKKGKKRKKEKKKEKKGKRVRSDPIRSDSNPGRSIVGSSRHMGERGTGV